MYEAPESVYLAIDFVHNAQSSSSSSSMSFDILDNEPPTDLTVRFAPPANLYSDIRVSENAGFYSRDVVLSRPSTDVVTVIVGSLPSNANGFDATTQTLVFQPGETHKTFKFAIFDDLVDEPDEFFRFSILGATKAALDPVYGTTAISGYIVDNDAPTGPTVRFAAAPTNLPVVDETAGTVRVTVELTAASRQTITAVVDDYAFDGTNVRADTRTVTFRPGETSASFDVAVANNSTVDFNAAIQLHFGQIIGATPDYSSGAASALTIRVRDDEGALVTQGSEASETLVAALGANDLFGLGGNDRIISRGYDNHISGGAGTDTAIYLRPAKAYDIVADGTGSGYVHARDLSGLPAYAQAGYAYQKHDSLDSIERIEFSDGTLAFDSQSAAAQVYRLYGSVLGRTPDYYGGQYWTHQLESGRSLADITSAFTGSGEFLRLTAGFSHADLVEYAYRSALGRASDPVGKAGWVHFLDEGHSVAELMASFSESAEHIAQTRAALDHGLWTARQSYEDVEFMYLSVFGRVADAAGLTYWADRVENGLTKHDLAVLFTQSAEYQKDIAGLNNDGIVDHLYATALHRTSDTAGHAAWTAFLAAGNPVADLVLAFQASEEFHVLALPNVMNGVSFSGGNFTL